MAILSNVNYFKENIDTIKCSTPSECLVDHSTLLSHGWKMRYKKGVFQESFYRNTRNINFNYSIEYRSLTVTVSPPKVMTGSNTSLFDFQEVDLFFNTMDILIENVLKNCFIFPRFEEWNTSRLDVNADIPFAFPKNKDIYLDLFSRIDLSEHHFLKTNYLSGTQFKKYSQAFLAYWKQKEILDRNPNKISDADRSFLENSSNTHMRIEFQLKYSTLYNRYGKNRTIKSLLTPEVITTIYDDFIKKFDLDLKVLTKTELFEFIDSHSKWGEPKRTRMKKYFQDLNELTSDEFNILYSNGKYKHYKNELQAKNVSIYYFSQKPTEIVDFKNKTVTIDPKVLFNYVVQNVVERILESVLKYDIVKVLHFDTFKELLKMVLLHSYPDRGS